MTRSAVAAATLFATILTCSAPSPNDVDFQMLPIDELPRARIEIIGGKESPKGKWPATFIFEKCTSTAVGPRVLLTAAHCVRDGATGYAYSLEGKRIKATCRRQPGFQEIEPVESSVASCSETPCPRLRVEAFPDFALCLLEQPLDGVVYETINTDPGKLGLGESLLLTGVGCTKDTKGWHSFGTHYEGTAEIQTLPQENGYLTTTCGGAAVCFGDSGGGAYLSGSGSTRLIIGINAHGDTKQCSWISTTSVDGFVTWAREFATRHDVKICGIHPKCRS